MHDPAGLLHGGVPAPRILPAVLLMLAFIGLCVAGARQAAMAAPDAASAQRQQPLNPALAQAPSPYLRHHAGDAVRWRRWGTAALREAKQRGVPIFLSVGYLSCYWCGVIQRESFTNAEVAALLHRHFVPVLVDREARPDLDTMYLEAARLLRGGVAGWPNNVFLTTEGKPFRAVGYLPRADFVALLRAVAAQWRDDRDALRRQAEATADAVRRKLTRVVGERAALSRLDAARIRRLAEGLAARFDPFFGGLDRLPKHLRPATLMLLARVALAHESQPAREALLRSLRMMTLGAVFDHLQGGFFRYATDAAWHVPHFEKMLSDQALMADALLAGWRISGDAWLLRTALRTLDFALRHLQRPAGGFATALSAIGADGGEGSFYLFTPRQLRALLGEADAEWAVRRFGQLADGELAGKVVVQLQDVKMADDAERTRLQRVLRALRAALRQRQPHARDEKVISGWNGLMIGALARAALLRSDDADAARRLAAAQRAARFVLKHLLRRGDDGRWRLARHWLDGAAHGESTLADHAYLVDGLLALHDARADAADEQWLQWAVRLTEAARQRFFDEASGRWWQVARHSGFMRLAPPPDGALPAADAVMALNLLRLAARTGDDRWQLLAERTLAARLAPLLRNDALDPGQATLLRAADVALHGDDGMPRHATRGQVRAWAAWLPDGADGDVLAAGSDATDAATTTAGVRRPLKVRVRVAPGWHVQAHRPDDPNLIPTVLRLLRPTDGRLGVRYPPPVRKRLAFAAAPLQLFDGGFEIEALLTLPRHHEGPVALQLQVQACSDTICLPPEQLVLYLPAPGE